MQSERMKIIIINGPNLNLLGVREPETYGYQSFEDFFETLRKDFPGIELHYFQSNSEGVLIDELHKHGFSANGIILNAGALTHTSVALADAISSISTPVIEVHLSNIFKRESFRHRSFIAPVCLGSVSGFGLLSYRLAVEAFLNQ